MCFYSPPSPPPIPPPLPLPPTPKAPPPPRNSSNAPQTLNDPNDNIGIKTQQSKRDRAATTSMGTNQLKINLNTGSKTDRNNINLG